MQDAIHNRDSPGVREETALHGSRGFGAVSFWLDVVAGVGRLWCTEPLKEVWTVQDYGSWFSCGARSVTHCVVTQKICFAA